jgi:hypothetical protein
LVVKEWIDKNLGEISIQKLIFYIVNNE